MKKIYFIVFFPVMLVLFLNTACTKEPVIGSANTGIIINPPPPPSLPFNTAPRASAGSDKMVFLPASICLFYAWASDSENNISTIAWEKISGPNSFLIENPSLLSPQIKNLVQGVYQFKLKVTDLYGLFIQDTVIVTVGQISTTPNEIFMHNLIWGTEGFNGPLLWGSAIMIRNIYQYIPTGRVFKMFIRKGNSTSWEEILIGDNALYSVHILNGTLGIWSSADETETVSIKLVY